MEIIIAKDYTEYPGLRHCSISEWSGEDFYHKVLNGKFKDALDKNEKITINLDGTAGYASSFLDEVFGNLVYDFSFEKVNSLVVIISKEEPHWKTMIEEQTYNQWEKRRKENKPPKVTVEHEKWYRFNGDKIECKIWEQPVA